MKIKAITTKSLAVLTAITVAVGGLVIAPLSTEPAAAAEARPFSPFGVAGHPMWSEYENRAVLDRELDLMAANGARWLRFDASWASFQDGTRSGLLSYWTNRMDYLVTAAQARGIQLQPVLLATPSWANGGQGYWVPPTNNADFANFVYLMVSRYRNSIKHWELWNEPNWNDFWKPGPNAKAFTELLKAGYNAAKRADPDSKVISGGLVHSDAAFLQQMYNNGARGYFDYLGLHPYPDGRSPYYESKSWDRKWNYDGIADMRATMDANGDVGKKIWISEAGWTSCPNDPYNKSVSEEQQALYIEQAFQRIMQEFPYVEAVMIYNGRDKGTSPTEREHHFGLVRRDFSAKPALAAYKRAATRWYQSATIDASPKTIYNGGSSTLTVQTPEGATPVTIQQLTRGGSWTDVETTTTSAEGAVQLTVKPTAATSYRAVTGELVSNTVTIKVRAKASIKPSRRVIRPRRYVKLTGRVLLAKSSVVVLQRRVGRRWRNVRRVRTNWAGSYGVWLRLARRGRYVYRIKFYGNSSQLGTYSRPTPLRVR